MPWWAWLLAGATLGVAGCFLFFLWVMTNGFKDMGPMS